MISMIVMCYSYGIVIVEYDEIRRGLPSAPLHMKHDNNRK